MNIRELLYQNEKKDLLRFNTAGSVDDGKSTLIGRLLYDSKALYDDHISSLKKGSTEREIDYSLLLDGLKAEREQGITIDVAYRFFSTPKRKFIIADTPGHEQYTRNMVTGASTSDLAVILIDATKGILPQTKRHSFIASLLGIKHIIVAINKMDLVDHSSIVFSKIKQNYTDFSAKLSVNDIHFIPISALKGDNIVENSTNMPWYKGATFLEYLETVHIASDRNFVDLRFIVQLANRPNMNFRGYCGTLASGILRKGDEVTVLPSCKQTRIKSILTFNGEIDEAYPPMSITVTMQDEIDIGRGNMIVHKGNIPEYGRTIDTYVVWMNEFPMIKDKKYLIKQNNSLTPCFLSKCCYKFNINTLSKEEATSLKINEIGRVNFELSRKIIFDPYSKNKNTGSFILIDPVSNLTVGAGMILGLTPDKKISTINPGINLETLIEHKSKITLKEREVILKNKPFTIWITGIPGSGKTDLCYSLEKALFDMGFLSFVIDGENLRKSISADLGFTAEDRSENTRRAAYLASLCNLNGMISIVGLASPYENDRNTAREIIGKDKFMLIYIGGENPLGNNSCTDQHQEQMNFYEKPLNPDISISLKENKLDYIVDTIISKLKKKCIIQKKNMIKNRT